MAKNPCIIGVGMTKFGNLLETPEIKDKTFQELLAEAAFEAYDDADISPEEIDAFLVGNMLPETSMSNSQSTNSSDWLALRCKPGFHIDTACDTTLTAIGIARDMINSGRYRNILVVGAEITNSYPDENADFPLKRKPLPPTRLWKWTDYAVDHNFGYQHFYGFDALAGIGGLSYMKTNNLSFEEFDRVMLQIHKNVRLHASTNPKAFLYGETLEQEAEREGFSSVEDYWKSEKNPFMAWPVRRKSGLTTADGASAIILSSEPEKYAKKLPIEVSGFGYATYNWPWDGTADVIAFNDAYKMAGIKPEDIDYLSVHDCLQTAYLDRSEVAGYFKKGEAWKAILDGRTRFDGDKPMDTSGGRHGVGHAFEASAGADAYEVVKQMRGEAGERQIKKPLRVAVQHNGGYALHAAVAVYKPAK
jgi:acetyl-CoA C-acetyltransferase